MAKYSPIRLPAQYVAVERGIYDRFVTLREASVAYQSNGLTVLTRARLPTLLCCEPLVGTSCLHRFRGFPGTSTRLGTGQHFRPASRHGQIFVQIASSSPLSFRFL